MMADKIAIARIAAAVNVLRPDWPTASVQTLLERDHAYRPAHDLAVAAVWVATDPASKTPARLSEPGPWWAALNTSSTPTAPRFDLDEWHAEFRAGATPTPADFRELVEAAKSAAFPPADIDRPCIGANDRKPS